MLKPDFARACFEGEAAIEIEVDEPTARWSSMRPNWRSATARLVGDGGRELAATVSYRPEEEQLVLGPPETLSPGPWRLDLAFSGQLNDLLHGFYRSKFVGKTGEEAWLAATQFESTDARRAFPCWDEPDLKATFGVTDRGR